MSRFVHLLAPLLYDVLCTTDSLQSDFGGSLPELRDGNLRSKQW